MWATSSASTPPTDNIDESQVAPIWPQVDEADEKEVGQFVNESAFRAVRRDSLGTDCAIIDAIWVRKWKKDAYRANG